MFPELIVKFYTAFYYQGYSPIKSLGKNKSSHLACIL